MTSENQSLLDAIRGIVEQAVAPLGQRIDGLSERVDGLTEQVGGLTERVDGLTERMDRFESEQREQRRLLQSIDGRLTNLEGRVRHLEDSIETLDTRTSQISSDLLDLKDHVADGFRALKRESELALRQVSELQGEQKSHRKRIADLEERMTLLQRRLEKLESRQNQ